MSTKGEEFFVELTRLRKFVMLEACALPGWLLTLSHQCLLVNMLLSVKLRFLPNVSSHRSCVVEGSPFGLFYKYNHLGLIPCPSQKRSNLYHMFLNCLEPNQSPSLRNPTAGQVSHHTLSVKVKVDTKNVSMEVVISSSSFENEEI